MGDYTGGYTSAVNDQSRRGVEDAQRKQIIQALMQQAQLYQQQQEERQRSMQGRRVIEQLLPQLANLKAAPDAGGPQPPPPGASSMPMMPPPQAGAAPPAPAPAPAPQGPSTAGGAAMPNPAMLAQFLTRAAPGGAPSMPPPPAPGGAPMAQAGGPGAPMPAGAPPAGAGAPMPPQPWKSLPKPPEAPPGPGGLPMPPENAVMPREQLSVGDLAKFLSSKGIKGEEALAAIEQWKPYMDTQNKTELEALKVKYQAQTAAVRAYQAVLRDAERARHNESTEGAASERNRIAAIAANRPRGGGAGTGGKATWKQSTIDYYAERAMAGDYSWRVGLSRTGQGANNLNAVDDRMAELSAERGSTATGDASNRALRTATEKALNDRTKFLAAGQQFVGNFQKQADLVEKYLGAGAAGEAPVINRWIQKGRKAIAGDPAVTAFDTAIRGLAREHQRIVTGVTSNSQLHVSAQETADELLNKDMAPAQVRSTLKVMREEADNAVKSGQDEVAQLQTELKTIGTGGGSVREFKTEEEAKAAGLKPGTKVKINGVTGTWQ